MMKADETSGSVLFEEEQKFPGWIKVLTTGIIIFTIAIILIEGFTGPVEKRGDMWIALAIAVPLEILIIVLFQNVVLEKVVTSNGLYYRWRPWQKKYRYIEKESMESFEVRRFPFTSYGFGWFPGYGRYNKASAGEGLQLHLENGRKFYFSTADIDSFKKAMNHLISPFTKSV